MLWCVLTNIWRHCSSFKWNTTGLPAVCSFGWQDIREEHFSQLPEVEELISATAKGYVEIRSIFFQGSLLKKLCVLYYRGEQARKVVCCFFYGAHKEKTEKWVIHVSDTFLSCFADYFNVLHGNFKKLLCNEGCHVHLREKERILKQLRSASKDFNATPVFICHLLCAADQHSCKEAQSHPELVHERLIIRDVSEKKHSTVTAVTTYIISHHFILYYDIMTCKRRMEKCLTCTKDTQSFPKRAPESWKK